MTNEQLAVLIQSGQKEYIERLWQQCEKFIALKADHWRYNSTSLNPIDSEDLKSEGYFALLDAVRYFNPEKGYKFLTYLTKTLKNRFIHTSKKSDALHYADSIDKAVTDDGDLTIGDCLEDRDALKKLENVEHKETVEYVKELFAEACEACLLPKQIKVVNAYLQTNSLTGAAELLGVTKQNIDNIVQSVSYRLRHCSYTQRLKEALLDLPDEFDYTAEGLKHTGLQFYKDTGYSSVERAAELHEMIKRKVKTI